MKKAEEASLIIDIVERVFEQRVSKQPVKETRKKKEERK